MVCTQFKYFDEGTQWVSAVLSPWHSIQAVSPFITRDYMWDWVRESTDNLSDGDGACKYKDMAGKVESSENMLQ